jgi:HEAT repeat protein
MDRNKHHADDPRSVEELIRIALTDPKELRAWDAVTFLHRRGSREVLANAEQLCASSNAKERELGANILGQLGMPQRTFPSECLTILDRMLATENDSDVLQAIAFAFGYLQEPDDSEMQISPISCHDDRHCEIVQGSGSFDQTEAIRLLIELSRDADAEVRDWATFGLGSLTDLDTDEIREALWARISDTNSDTRAEALIGLALRKDSRVIEALLNELRQGQENDYLLEAARQIGNPKLMEALEGLKLQPQDSKADLQALPGIALQVCEENTERCVA